MQSRYNKLIRQVNRSPVGRRINLVARTRRFGLLYATFAAAVLLASTIIWSVLGAQVQANNADQLVDPYLFRDHQTFAGAQFPGAHTFLIKWPLFVLVRWLHYSPNAFLGSTVALAVVTVAGLAYALYRIDRRPLAFGTTCLALASVLLLVPAQPYAGALLPVNFAMLATRNIEYVIYLVCLVGFASRGRFRSWRYWLAVASLGLLIASDKLFLTLSAGGAFILLISYALSQSLKFVNLAVNWLIGTALAASLAGALLWGLNATRITHIVDGSGSNPYGLITTVKDGLLGSYYALTGLLTTFGANPAYDAVEIKQVGRKAVEHLHAFAALSYLVNISIFLVIVWAAWRIVRSSVAKRTSASLERELTGRVVLMLIASTLVAGALFVGAKHYYPVDARYLSIAVCAGFIVVALYFRRRKLAPILVLTTGFLLLLSTVASLPSVFQAKTDSQQVIALTDSRNLKIDRALARHHVTTLVGDYWRVIPIQTKLAQTTVQPLGDCTHPRNTLTTTVWNQSLKHRSFAYLLSYEKGLTDFPVCNLDQVSHVFGRPNGSLLISGSYDHPTEQLLFYDNGMISAKTANKAPQQVSGTVKPIALGDVPYGACYTPTILSIVAHQDDDLLFQSPDLIHSVQNADCIRTIYLTAGDAGQDTNYSTGRQQGAEAAYSAMLGSKVEWVQRIVKLATNRYIMISNPRGNTKVSLIFMNLPDGNLRGEGFARHHNQSLQKLRDGKISAMYSVDGQSVFSNTQLIAALSSLMHVYQPAEIRTQADLTAQKYVDHSDHIATKWFVDQARLSYQHEQFNNNVSIPIKYYVGYPIREREPNVFGSDLEQKDMTFITYAQHDGGVCATITQCEGTPTYGSYLRRQYQQNGN